MLVIAHRGASAYLPENTLPAFERAIEQGADFVEFDVQNDLSVTHDTPRRGVVYPTLAEVLDLCHGRIGVMVELKRPRGDTLRRALSLMCDDDVLVCFQRRAIEEAHALRSGIRTVQHVGLGVSIRRAAGLYRTARTSQVAHPSRAFSHRSAGPRPLGSVDGTCA